MYTKKGYLLAKIESTPGTDPTPTVAANAVEAFEIELVTKGDMKQRAMGMADRSFHTEVRGQTQVDLKFKTFLKGSGNAGTIPRWDPLVRACDRVATVVSGTSVTYYPAATYEACTVWVNMDGILVKLNGCAGDCEVELVAGEPAFLNFTLSGNYALPTDSVVTAPTYDSSSPLIVKNSTTTFGSYAAIIEKMMLKFGNTIVARKDFTVAEAIRSFIVTNRNPEGMISCEAVLRATSNADFMSYFDAGTTKALSMVLSGGAGNIVTVTAPVCVLRAPKWGDRDGLRTFDVDFQMARNSGNDEMVIALT